MAFNLLFCRYITFYSSLCTCHVTSLDIFVNIGHRSGCFVGYRLQFRGHPAYFEMNIFVFHTISPRFPCFISFYQQSHLHHYPKLLFFIFTFRYMPDAGIPPQMSDHNDSLFQDPEKISSGDQVMLQNVPSLNEEQDILASQSTNPVLDAKMQIVHDVKSQAI